jgi:hypothetical protein
MKEGSGGVSRKREQIGEKPGEKSIGCVLERVRFFSLDGL